MDPAFFDRALVWWERPERREILVAAQAAHMETTGVFEAGEPWWEERIRHFHDWFLFHHVLADGRTPLGAFVRDAWSGLSEVERDIYGDLLGTCHRSLFEIERLRGEEADLVDRIGRARYAVALEAPAAGWEPGDLIDATILRSGDTLVPAGGVLFHPRPAREAMLLLVEYARDHEGRAPWGVVDLFARMKLAFDRSDNPRVAAIYTPQSYLYRDYVARLSPAPP